MHLRPVDRDHPDAHQPGIRAQPQHLPEQLAQRALVTNPEARDRGVIGRLVGRDHPKRDVLATAPLDPPRRALADRVRVHDQRHHHRRIVRRAALPVGAIGGKERGQIELRRPRRSQTTRSDPRAATRAGSAATTTPARDHTPEVLRHPGIVLNRPDGTALCATATMDTSSQCATAPSADAAARWRRSRAGGRLLAFVPRERRTGTAQTAASTRRRQSRERREGTRHNHAVRCGRDSVWRSSGQSHQRPGLEVASARCCRVPALESHVGWR